MRHYILNERGEPIPEDDLLTWAVWFENNIAKGLCVVNCETVGDCEISTVFLSLPHVFCEENDLLLWETRIFGGDLDEEIYRCSGSREQAEAMHERVKALVIAKQQETKQKRNFNFE